jgi:hypothetical protein
MNRSQGKQVNRMGVSTDSDPRIPKFSTDELAWGQRVGRHLAIGLKALCAPFVLSGLVLANGNSLSSFIDINSSSMLFRLWPFNWVYLQQFINSPYDGAQIRWFFTVVSCSNAIWLAFICWKIIFELFRRDVRFPRAKSPAIIKFILGFLIAGCVALMLISVVMLAGFGAQGYGFFALAFNQSIAAGAIKIVMLEMSGFYVGASFVLEFGGLGLRYWLSRRFGYFVAETTDPKKERVKLRRGRFHH